MRAAPWMFEEAARTIVKQIGVMKRDIGKQLQKEVVATSLDQLLTAYTPLWDEMGDDCLRTRRKLAPKVAGLLIEADNAVRRLEGRRSGGVADGAAPSPDEEEQESEDLMDTTEAHMKAKRMRQEEETIDLSTMDDSQLAQDIPEQNNSPSTSGVGCKMKPEPREL